MRSWEIVPLRAFADNPIWTLRDARPVLDYLRAKRLELAAMLNSHHHAIHVGGSAGLLQPYRAPVYGPHVDRIREVTDRLNPMSARKRPPILSCAAGPRRAY